jgi:hypothetical protein
VSTRLVLIVLAVGVAAAAIVLLVAIRSGGDAPTPRGSPTATAPAPAPDATPSGAARPDRPPAEVTDPHAQTERETLVADLRASGSGAEPWDAQGTALLAAIGRRAVATSQAGCFTAGCAATFTFASRTELDRARIEAARSPQYRAWTGGKRWTTPEVSRDRVVITLLLYRPD